MGGRRAATPEEEEYARAVATLATRRRELTEAAKADAEARKALLQSAAEYGPVHPETDAARRRWDAARAELANAGAAATRANERIARALAAWANAVAAAWVSE
ncbi:hypothetical protein ACLEPN_30525 [Myxococcus sp. 1LA]